MEAPYIDHVIRTMDSEICMLNQFHKMLFFEGVGKPLLSKHFHLKSFPKGNMIAAESNYSQKEIYI